jgi:hypothetical protein
VDLRKAPSRRWSRSARSKSNKGYGTPDVNKGRESEDEEGSSERNGAGKRRKLRKKGDDSIGGVVFSLAKNTRLST